MVVLDQGIERAKQLPAGAIAVDHGKEADPRLLLGHRWLRAALRHHPARRLRPGQTHPPLRLDARPPEQHHRSEFLFAQQTFRPGNVPVADQGQIQLDLFGRINGAGWHWAGEADVFEAIAAVKKRFPIDDKRIMLRGFSQGGEGAWHVALHHPDRFAAVEIGAGTWSRRAQTPGLPPYQYAVLKIWENMEEWALNAFNLPLAGHDGDADTQISSIPGPPPGTPSRGQLESSLRARAQLEKEGFPAEGEPDFLRMKGTPAIFLISQNTGHGTSPLVRQRLDAFLKEWGDKGQSSPDHIRFLTYTTRYNRDYWVSVDALDRHYERADIDASRTDAGTTRFRRTTSPASRLRETDHAREIKIDGQTLKVKPAPAITLEKTAGAWKLAKDPHGPACTRQHALQGPIDDAFLDPVPAGPPHRHAVECRRQRPGAPLHEALRPPVGQILPRPPLRQGRQGRHRRRHGEVSRRPLRRPRQQSVDRENARQTSRPMDPRHGDPRRASPIRRTNTFPR